MATKVLVRNIMRKYGSAWESRDPEAITKIFTKNCIYKERAFNRPFVGHGGLKRYWTSKVIGEQKNIRFKLLNIFADRNTATVEFETKFYDKKRRTKKHLKSIAIITIKNGKIHSWREYWHSKK